MLRILRRKGSPFFYLRGAVRGYRVFETTGTDDRDTADALRIKRESELLERSVFGDGATITFAEAAVSYLEFGGEAKYLGRYDEKIGKWTRLLGLFGSVPVSKIGQAEADSAASGLHPGAGPATRKRQVYGPLLAVLHHAARRKWCPVPAIAHPKVPTPVTRYSTPERLERLLPHCRPQLRRFIMLIAYTGARLSEALRIDWDRDVDLNRRTITIRRTKTGKVRAAPIAPALLTELSLVPAGRRHGRLFSWTQKASVYPALKGACERAGVDYMPTHQQGRHTYATWLRIYAKRDLRGIMEDGGWDSVQSVIRYEKVVPGETARAVESLPAIKIDRKERADEEAAVSADLLRQDRRERRKVLRERLERSRKRARAVHGSKPGENFE